MKRLDLDLKTILAAVLGVAVVAVAGYLLTDVHSAWYRSLIKPGFMPPAGVFSIAWTALYALLAAALVLVALKRCGGGRGGVWPVAIMVGLLNIGWTFAFFNRQNMAAAMVLLLVLLGGSVLLTQRIFRCSKLAAALTLPYLVWLGFALVLNYAFILIN